MRGHTNSLPFSPKLYSSLSSVSLSFSSFSVSSLFSLTPTVFIFVFSLVFVFGFIVFILFFPIIFIFVNSNCLFLCFHYRIYLRFRRRVYIRSPTLLLPTFSLFLLSMFLPLFLPKLKLILTYVFYVLRKGVYYEFKEVVVFM